MEMQEPVPHEVFNQTIWMPVLWANQYRENKVTYVVYLIALSLLVLLSQRLCTYWSKTIFWDFPASGTASMLRGVGNTEQSVYNLHNAALQCLQWQPA